MARGLRAAFVFAVGCFSATAYGQSVCSESHRCLNTIGSPGRYASIGLHRLLFANGELVWPSFIGLHALDLDTGRTRTIPHCGTSLGDVALEGSTVYMLADHAVLCRVSLASGQSVQTLVSSPDTVIEGFAVSSAAFAYSMRRRGEQPELRVAQWSNGQWRTFLTAVTVEHIVVDATTVYWIDAGVLLSASLATGAKLVGPTIPNHVTRMRVDHGVAYVATDREVLRLDSAGRSWITLAHEGADDLAVDGSAVYWASTSRGKVTKLGATATAIASSHEPYAIALDAAGLFVAEEDPFVLKHVVPR